MKIRIIFTTIILSFSGLAMSDKTPVEATPVATINGVSITEPEVKHFISKLTQNVPAERVLQELINIELLVQAAKNEGVMKDDSLNLEIKRLTSGAIASHYLQQQLLKNTNPETLKARYRKLYIDQEMGKEYNANHILVKTEDEAKAIIKQLDNGAIFTDLAKKLSTGPSGKSGGALGWFKPTDMVPPFSKAAIALVPESYTKQPVETQFGWHVIKLNQSRNVEPPSFESVKQTISQAIASEEVQKIMKKLHDSASIEFPDK